MHQILTIVLGFLPLLNRYAITTPRSTTNYAVALFGFLWPFQIFDFHVLDPVVFRCYLPTMDDLKNKVKGAYFGLFVGDALGTTLEFKDRDTYEHITDMVGGGPFNLQPGEWTDDGSMAMALATTLAEHGMDRIELLKNFTRWYKQGKFSVNGRCFDIGSTTQKALRKFIDSQGLDPNPASTDFMDSGNGGIMRLAPVVVYATTLFECGELAVEQSSVTHDSMYCRTWARMLGELLWKLSQNNTLAELDGIYEPDLEKKARRDISSSGYVLDTYEAAVWSALQTSSFKEALLLAVNLGDDADTVGAVTGQIAGAMYGYDAIPQEWLDKIAMKPELDELFDKMWQRRIEDTLE